MCIVQAEEPLLLNHLKPLLLEILQELAQGHHRVVGIDGDVPGDNVCVHPPLTVKQHKHHLLGAAHMHIGLHRARQALLESLFLLPLGLRFVVGHHHLIHRHSDVVQH